MKKLFAIVLLLGLAQVGYAQNGAAFNPLQPVVLKSSTGEVVLEPTTHAVPVLDYSHAELHSGSDYVVRNTALLTKNTSKDILIITPNTLKWAHMVYGYESTDSAIQAFFYEAPTWSATGTVDGVRNRNRNFLDNNTTLVYNDPTITATGTLLTQKWIGSGKNSGGDTRETAEFILKQNTAYLLRFTEVNVANTHINWELDWYEHTNKE